QERTTMIKGYICCMPLAFSLGALGAQAYPVANLQVTSMHLSDLQKTTATCWWRNSVRHCAYGYRSWGYRGPYYPEAYRLGSRRWWQEMDRAGRGGRR